MNIQEKEENWLWLCAVPELDWKEKMTLLHYFGSPWEIRSADREEFADWERLGIAWIRKLYPCLKNGFLEGVRREMEKKGVHFISREHPDFPKRLRTIADCPYGLFYKGSLPATAPLSVGIVGARACSAYGQVMAQAIGKMLALEGAVVVSGMAMGIDGIAQRAAVERGGTSFAVLGCGVEQCYPRSNIELYMRLQEKGGILSEYPCGTPAEKFHFPARNRIISGMCDVVAVIEARSHSGSLITARQALEQGRDVYALPGRVDDPLSAGCNALIGDGAGVILSAEDFVQSVLDNYEKTLPAEEEKGGPGEEKMSGKEKGEAERSRGETEGDHERLKRKITEPEKRKMPETKGLKGHCERGRTKVVGAKNGRQMGLAPDDDLVYSVLDLSPVSRESLSAKTGLSMGKIQEILLRLQLKDLAAEVAKNQFIRQ